MNKLLKESLFYLGRSYWGLPNQREEVQSHMDRGKLYLDWGHDSAELEDFEEAYQSLIKIPGEELNPDEDMARQSKLLLCITEVLQLRLRKAAETFEFLCESRLRIELRDLDFKKELNDRIVEFMDEEMEMLERSEGLKRSLSQMEVSENLKEKRMRILEEFEGKLKSVSEGMEAFYERVRDYIKKG